MGNPVINYYNAVLEADLPCYPKMALQVLIKNMDYNTRQTYIGTTKIAKKMGVSYNTARRALDALEKEHRLIKFVGMHLINPGSADATQIFEILIKPVPSEDTRTLSGYNPPPSRATSTLRGRQSIQSGASTDSGVDLSGVDVVSRETHTYTHSDASASEYTPNGDRSGTTPTPKPASLKDSVPETQPGLLIPEPTANSVKAGSSDSAAAPAQKLADDELRALVSIFLNITKAESTEEEVEEGLSSLRAYNGHLRSARLALLMFWAFRVSNYWSKEENWQALDMENFLSASGALDKQFNPEKWRQHDGLVKKFPTAQAVMNFLIPPVHDFTLSPEEVCEESQHIWVDASHATQRCSTCGIFRANPLVAQWTTADDLEAEYVEMAEFYPYEDYRSLAELEESRPTQERSGHLAEAESIIERLNQQTQSLSCRGYGVPQLIFSDLSSVSSTDWPLYEDVETLLRAGERPLGFIAALRDCRGEPFVETWHSGDENTCAELRASAHLRYYHRM